MCKKQIMSKFEFIGIDALTEEAFKRHPIWVFYEDPEQDEEMISWGINLNEAWNDKKNNKEQEYYYPFLGSECPSLVRGIYLYCKVKLATGQELHGYLSGGFSFGIFAKDKKYTFNINMPDYAKTTAKELMDILSIKIESLSSISFEPISSLYTKPVSYEKFW